MVTERKFLFNLARASALFLVGLLAAGWISAYFFPPIVAWTENRLGQVLLYELIMRFYLGGLIFLLLAGYSAWVFYRREREQGLIVMVGWLAWLILLGILIFDTGNPLKDEPSWIRYPTSGFLTLAAALLWLVSRHFNRGEKWPSRRETVWYLLSAGVLFAAADEVLQIHERVGTFLENTFKLAHLTTDLITVFYAVVGLVVLWFIWPTLRQTIGERSPLFGKIYFFGFLFFGLATALDTLDGFLLKALRRLAAWLASRPGFNFSEAWQMLYDPKVFANSLEEILEYFAAVLFFIGALLLLRQSHRLTKNAIASNAGKRSAAVGCGLIVLAVVAQVWFNQAMIFSRSPLVSGEVAEIIASAKDGLFHTDDLAYHPKWGLVIANESHPSRRGKLSGPAVFVYKDGVLKKLADPKRLLADTDSLAVDESAVYASDGAQGKILRYQSEELGWEELYTRKNGLQTPESLDVHQGIMTILDERKKSVTEIGRDGKVNIQYPRHELFVSPEGIVYHPQLKSYLITDDESGTIFSYQSGGEIKVWAGKNIGLKNPEDILVTPKGEVIITDNGRGEVMLLSQDGALKKSLRFRPLYRDLQGVALDEPGNLYVVSADAHDYASFMPSFVWKIKNFYP